MTRNILINTFGIQDSGGVTVLEKMLQECILSEKYIYYIFVFRHPNMINLLNKFVDYEEINFIEVQNKGILHRLYFENVYFSSFIKEQKISLIYNFSGSNPFITKIPTLIKVQNLIFYSKKLDEAYKRINNKMLWLKQIWLKRLIFISMLKQSQNLEIQSTHVKDSLSNFMSTIDKNFYLKNDFFAKKESFNKPKKYNFEKKLTFLYIVGPHFNYPHKNIQDFVKTMCLLKESGKDFEIQVTLNFDELNASDLWDTSLNENTTFLGYLKDKNEVQKLFQDNTILISTSVIETIGLHIIEGIQKGILCIAPDEMYSKSVYGNNLLKYKLFNSQSLTDIICKIYDMSEDKIQEMIRITQRYIINNEASKFDSIIDIFDKILEK